MSSLSRSYLLAVADHYKVNVFRSTPAADSFIDTFRLVDIQEASSRLSEEPGVVLDGFAFGRRVDDTKHLLEMLLQQLRVWSAFALEVVGLLMRTL